MERRSLCGSGGCETCPFSHNERAEQVANYGCLPSAADIRRMKELSGHGDESVMCDGFARYVTERRPDLNLPVGGRISYTVWYHDGKDAA